MKYFLIDNDTRLKPYINGILSIDGYGVIFTTGETQAESDKVLYINNMGRHGANKLKSISSNSLKIPDYEADIYKNIINGFKKIFESKIGYLNDLTGKLDYLFVNYDCIGYITIDDCHWLYGFIVKLLKLREIRSTCVVHGTLYSISHNRNHIADAYCVQNVHSYELLRNFGFNLFSKVYLCCNYIAPKLDNRSLNRSSLEQINFGFLETWASSPRIMAFQEECLIVIKNLLMQFGCASFYRKPHPYSPHSTDYDNYCESIENLDDFVSNSDVIFSISPSSALNHIFDQNKIIVCVFDESLGLSTPYFHDDCVIHVEIDLLKNFIDSLANDFDFFLEYHNSKKEKSFSKFAITHPAALEIKKFLKIEYGVE